jgi:hypothetical protein
LALSLLCLLSNEKLEGWNEAKLKICHDFGQEVSRKWAQILAAMPQKERLDKINL